MINSSNSKLQVAKQRKRNDVELSAAVLGKLFSSRVPLPSGLIGGGRVGEVVALLAGLLNFEQRPVQTDESKSELSQVSQALAGSDIRTREVTLDRGWINRNAMNMVVSTTRGLAVVTPGPQLRPMLLEVNGEPQNITQEMALDISTSALEIIRPLPQGSPSMWKLMLLSLSGSRRDMYFAVIATVLIGLLGLAIPVATDVIFTSVVPTGEVARLGAIFVVLVLLASASAVMVYTRTYLFIRISDMLDMTITGGILDRILRLPLSRLRDWTSARISLVLRISQDLQVLVSDTLNIGLLSFLFVLLNGVLMLVILPSLGIVAISFGVILLIITWFMIRHEREAMEREQQAKDHLAEATLDLIRGWIPVRLSNGETSAFGRWASAFAAHRTALNARWSSEIRTDLLRLIFLGAVSLAFVWTAYLLPYGEVTPAKFLAFLSTFSQFSLGIVGLTLTIRSFAQASVGISHYRPLLDIKPESGARHEDPGVLTGAIEFRSVGFRYGVEFPWVLRDVNFTVKPHEFVAIVGTSGSGKSTLLRLMLGFEQATQGVVAYDGTDISMLNVEAVRKQFGVVLQSSLLIPGTIRENISITTGPIPDSQLWELLERVEVADVVRSLPIALDTVIDEGAYVLSGGQRQRILLARAMAHSPAVLFLDEATSALDNISQKAVADRIGALGMTRIVIAHRLSTIESADKIIVLDKGAVAQIGTYSELISEQGLFAELVARQEL